MKKKLLDIIKYNGIFLFLLIGIASSIITITYYFMNPKIEYQKNIECLKKNIKL